MATEKPRGCGFRKVGGLYICTEPGIRVECDRLPFELIPCSKCGSGIKFSRGMTWLNWSTYAGEHKDEADCGFEESYTCPVCAPSTFHQPYGIVWVGERFYTPNNFAREALLMGTSRRIPFGGKSPAGPKNLVLGKTWLLFAYKNFFEQGENEDGEMEYNGGIFYCAKATKLEYLVWEKDAKPEYLDTLRKRGITPVVIPDDDTDHDPSTPLVTDESIRTEARNSALFNDISKMLEESE